RANAAKLSNGERRVVTTVISLIASWSRLSDWVYVQDVADLARLSERHTRRCLERLDALGIIIWQPRRGQSTKSRLGIPPVVKPDFSEPDNRTSWNGKPDALEVRRPRRDPEERPRGEISDSPDDAEIASSGADDDQAL